MNKDKQALALRLQLVGFALLILVVVIPVNGQSAIKEIKSAFDQCRKIVQPNMRLECYDKLELDSVLNEIKPRFSGQLSEKTETFTVQEPTIMRYQSDGAIFVLALHSSSGELVQNLHIGGGGEDTYLIKTPGDYFLRVNGSTTWRIWLEQH